MTINNQILRQVKDLFWEQQVRFQVWFQVEMQVMGQVYDQVEWQVRGPVGKQVRGLVFEEINQ